MNSVYRLNYRSTYAAPIATYSRGEKITLSNSRFVNSPFGISRSASFSRREIRRSGTEVQRVAAARTPYRIPLSGRKSISLCTLSRSARTRRNCAIRSRRYCGRRRRHQHRPIITHHVNGILQGDLNAADHVNSLARDTTRAHDPRSHPRTRVTFPRAIQSRLIVRRSGFFLTAALRDFDVCPPPSPTFNAGRSKVHQMATSGLTCAPVRRGTLGDVNRLAPDTIGTVEHVSVGIPPFFFSSKGKTTNLW